MLHSLIHDAAVPGQSNGQGNNKEYRYGPDIRQDLPNGVALEQNTPDNAQKVGERQRLADVLGPDRHAPEGEHEAGKQNRGQEKEKGHLHGLQLVPRQGGKGQTDSDVGSCKEQDKNLAEPERSRKGGG